MSRVVGSLFTGGNFVSGLVLTVVVSVECSGSVPGDRDGILPSVGTKSNVVPLRTHGRVPSLQDQNKSETGQKKKNNITLDQWGRQKIKTMYQKPGQFVIFFFLVPEWVFSRVIFVRCWQNVANLGRHA